MDLNAGLHGLERWLGPDLNRLDETTPLCKPGRISPGTEVISQLGWATGRWSLGWLALAHWRVTVHVLSLESSVDGRGLNRLEETTPLCNPGIMSPGDEVIAQLGWA